MVKKNNVKDSFELCYLRSRAAKSAFDKKDKINVLLQQPFFEKAVQVASKEVYRKAENSLNHFGYFLEDIRSIARVYGLQFANHEFSNKKNSDLTIPLTKFIIQRLNTFITLLNRKFETNEFSISNTDTSLLLDIVPDDSLSPIKDDDVVILEPVKTKNSKKETKALSKKIQKNIDLYAPRLAELATSKHTGYFIRKKARSICKKCGINYLEITLAKIKKHNLDPNQFALR
jgi:hypothetical protein